MTAWTEEQVDEVAGLLWGFLPCFAEDLNEIGRFAAGKLVRARLVHVIERHGIVALLPTSVDEQIERQAARYKRLGDAAP